MKHSQDRFSIYNDIFTVRTWVCTDEKMEAVYRKCSQNASFEEDCESTYYYYGGIYAGKRYNQQILQRPIIQNYL